MGRRRVRDAVASLTWRLCWWQVLGSNQRRLSRRFYSPILLFGSYAADLHSCVPRRDLGPPPSAVCPWAGSPGRSWVPVSTDAIRGACDFTTLTCPSAAGRRFFRMPARCRCLRRRVGRALAPGVHQAPGRRRGRHPGPGPLDANLGTLTEAQQSLPGQQAPRLLISCLRPGR